MPDSLPLPDNFLSSILIMLVCVMMSGYFSATETAFLSFNKTKMKALAADGDKRAALVLSLSDRYDKLITTILIGNNIVNILLASVSTLLFVAIYQDMGATISTAVSTVVVLIFGEITPKSVAKDYPDSFVKFSAPLISLLMWVFTPFNYIFSGWKKLVGRLLGKKEDSKMSQEELKMLVEEIQQDGSIDEEESDLLQNAITFTERRAEDILTHRVDLEGVSVDADKAEIARIFSQSRYSRLLVYRDSIDDIVGVIHQKDFYSGEGVTDRPLTEVMTDPLFVHPGTMINDLLKLLQTSKSHVAVVVDEHGGTYGIVTMEDILEELVGDIWDEHDEVVETFRKLDENLFLVDCAVNLDDFCEFFALKLESESVMLSGWVMEQTGKIPDVGDTFTYENLDCVVRETDGHRVVSLEVRQNPIADDADEKDSD